MMHRPELYKLHDEPIWRAKSNYIINAAIPDSEYFEQLYVRNIDGESYEVCCIPFFLYNVSLGDTVTTRVEGPQRYLLNEVTEQSSRYVYRAYFSEENLPNRGKLMDRLRDLDCGYEWFSRSLVAIDSRGSVAQEAANRLMELENLGVLIYETGRL
ncbi:DUF4265 domain-containing protein [Arthrobacter sp. RAF14]|uniref:DUF4265 domain-containing protein n=1 Tax=Arthrobacter sp. RAF14 TaxID=3233051 RepID=UPI003F8FBAA0